MRDRIGLVLLAFPAIGVSAAAQVPRRAHGTVTSFETGAILPSLDVTFYSSDGFRKTVTTDSAGRYSVEGLPEVSEIFFRVKCPIPARADTMAGPYLIPHPGMDTTLNVQVMFRACTHLDRRHRLIGGLPKGSTASRSLSLSPELASVYQGVLDALYPPGVSPRSSVMLEGFTTRPCRNCIESEVPRLVGKRLIDPSTVAAFETVRADTVAPPAFSHRGRIEVMPFWDLYWLGTSGRREWSAMKDAYPEVNAVISFAAVGFNNRRTEALVEFHADTAGSEDDSEIMLLRKSGPDWRVALRHVEIEATSGEWAGNRCEAGDAPPHPPTRAEIEKISGVFDLIRTVRLHEEQGFVNRTDSVRVRLDPLKPIPGKPDKLVSAGSVLDLAGKPNGKIAVEFDFAPTAATIDFSQRLPEGVMMLDGWLDQHKILRLTDGGFVGTWSTGSGPGVSRVGFFCARPVFARGE